MSISGLFKFGIEAWSLLASVAVHAAIVAVVLALPALAQPEIADEERVSVDVVTPQEFQEIIEEARLEPPNPEPEPELDPSVLEPPPDPIVNVKDEADKEAKSESAKAPVPGVDQDAEQKPEALKEPEAPDPLKVPKPLEAKEPLEVPEPLEAGNPPEAPEPSKVDEEQKAAQSPQDAPKRRLPRQKPGGTANQGPKSDAKLRQIARSASSIFPPGTPIVIPRKRVVPEEDEVLVGDRKREALCHDAAKVEVTKSRPELKPEIVISSAIIPSETAAHIIVANGAAFRAEGRWYNFKFRCEANPFEEKLISFDFLIGPAFPDGEVVEVKVKAEN